MSTDLHTLSGAYALNALTADEAQEFGTHIEACPACRLEVAEFQQVVAKWGATEALQPPAHLKSRVLAAVDREPQLPPLLPSAQEQEVVSDSEGRRPKWFPRLVAAAAALAAIAVGSFAFDQLNEPDSELAAGVTRVFDAEDASVTTMPTEDGSEISVATSPSLNRMAVDTHELPSLSDQQVYQLWAIERGEATSRGVLSDPDEGAAMGLPDEDVTVAITIEPEGGSQRPTTEPIMSVEASEV